MREIFVSRIGKISRYRENAAHRDENGIYKSGGAGRSDGRRGSEPVPVTYSSVAITVLEMISNSRCDGRKCTCT